MVSSPTPEYGLLTAHDRVRVDCTELSETPSCRVDARSRVVNPRDEPVAEPVRVAHRQASEVTLIPGARGPDWTGERRGESLYPPLSPESYAQGSDSLGSEQATLQLEPHHSQDLSVGSSFELVYRPATDESAHWLHPWVSSRRPNRRVFDYLLAPAEQRTEAHASVIEVSGPAGWTVTASVVNLHDPHWGTVDTLAQGEAIDTERPGETVRGEAIGAGANVLTAVLEAPSRRFNRGGPVVGGGGRFGASNEARGAARLGWELFFPQRLAHRAVVETDFYGQWQVVPSTHYALIPGIAVLAAGVGVPVRVAPDTEVGARLALHIHLGPIGIQTDVDFFPGLVDDRARDYMAGSVMWMWGF